MRLCYDNEWDKYDIYSVTGENSNFPASNTQNQILTTVYQSLACDVAQRIIIDCGADVDVTSVFISNHNLTNAATIKFEMHSTDDFTTPDVSETLTWRSTHIYKYFTKKTKRYISFVFTDVANTDTYIEIGRLFAGEYLQVSPSSSIPFKILNKRNDQSIITDGGAAYGTIGTSRRVIQYEFPATSDTMIESIRTMYNTVGLYKPLYLCNLDSTFTHIDIAYAKINNMLEEQKIGSKRTNYSLEFEECS